MEEYPVIIVGSGPAGAACAKALKSESIEVLILEKDELPRNKICSGILFGQTQVLLKQFFGSLPPKDMYCEPQIIKAASILEWSRNKGFSPYPWEIPKNGQPFPKDYLNVWRRNFDAWLLSKTGVPCKDKCMFNSCSAHDNKVKIEISLNNKEKKELCCSYLVGADGGSSQVKKALNTTSHQDNNEVVIYQTYYHFSDLGRLKDAHWYVFFEPQIGDILSCVHRKDDFLTLCVGGFKGRNLKESMEKFKTFLTDTFQVVLSDRERGEGCILRQSPPFLGKGRVLLTGEAAGMMYLNGEGISAALDSGYQAGLAIAQGLKKEGDVLNLYRKKTEEIVNHVKVCVKKIHFFA
jgi:flavin-dependent dehydrogenase